MDTSKDTKYPVKDTLHAFFTPNSNGSAVNTAASTPRTVTAGAAARFPGLVEAGAIRAASVRLHPAAAGGTNTPNPQRTVSGLLRRTIGVSNPVGQTVPRSSLPVVPEEGQSHAEAKKPSLESSTNTTQSSAATPPTDSTEHVAASNSIPISGTGETIGASTLPQTSSATSQGITSVGTQQTRRENPFGTLSDESVNKLLLALEQRSARPGSQQPSSNKRPRWRASVTDSTPAVIRNVDGVSSVVSGDPSAIMEEGPGEEDDGDSEFGDTEDAGLDEFEEAMVVGIRDLHEKVDTLARAVIAIEKAMADVAKGHNAIIGFLTRTARSGQ